MPIDISKVPESVLEAVLSNMGYDPEDEKNSDEESFKKRAAELSAEEAFEKFLNWHGMIGWTSSIIIALDKLRAAEIKSDQSRFIAHIVPDDGQPTAIERGRAARRSNISIMFNYYRKSDTRHTKWTKGWMQEDEAIRKGLELMKEVVQDSIDESLNNAVENGFDPFNRSAMDTANELWLMDGTVEKIGLSAEEIKPYVESWLEREKQKRG